MILVLMLSAIVIGVVGLLLGKLLAHYLPRPALFTLWGILLASAVYIFLQGRAAEEFDRIGANMLLFAILLPFLIGSMIAAFWVWRRQRGRLIDRDI